MQTSLSERATQRRHNLVWDRVVWGMRLVSEGQWEADLGTLAARLWRASEHAPGSAREREWARALLAHLDSGRREQVMDSDLAQAAQALADRALHRLRRCAERERLREVLA